MMNPTETTQTQNEFNKYALLLQKMRKEKKICESLLALEGNASQDSAKKDKQVTPADQMVYDPAQGCMVDKKNYSSRYYGNVNDYPTLVPPNYNDFVYKNKVIDFVNPLIQSGKLTVTYDSTRVSGILYWNATLTITDLNLIMTAAETTKDLAKFGVYRQYYDLQDYIPYLKAKAADRTLTRTLADSIPAETMDQLSGLALEGNSGDADEDGQNVLDTHNATNTMLTLAEGEDETKVADMKPTYSPHAFIDGGVHFYEQLADRFLASLQVDWTTTDTVGTLLAQIDMPRGALTANLTSPNAQIFNTYTYSVPQMTHYVQMNSTKFHSGTVIIAVRYNNAPADTTFITDSRQLFALPHVILQASSSNSSMIEVPFIYPQHFIPNIDTELSPALYYHTVYIGVVNPLGIGDGGSTTVTMRLYSKFSTDDQQTAFAMQRTRKQYTGDGPAASVVGAVSGVASSVSAVAGVVEKAATGIGSILPGNNNDRPAHKLDHPQVTIYSTPDLSLGDGPIDVVSLRMQKDTLTPFNPAVFPVNKDEFGFDYLKKVKGSIDYFTWESSDIHGTLLWDYSVTPITYTTIGDSYLYPTLSELAMNFLYYTGNIQLEFLCGNSQLQSGRLLILFAPDGSETPTPDTFYDYPFVIYDLQAQQIITFEVPNSCPTHMTPLRIVNNLGTFANRVTFGNVYVFVETPLRYPNSCASSLNVTILLNAHDNLKFYTMTTNRLEPNSGPDERIVDKFPLTSYKINSAPDTSIGEEYTAYNCARRFNRIATIDLTPTDSDTWTRAGIVFPVTPNMLFSNDVLTPQYDFLSQMASGFRYYKGSLRYVIHSLQNFSFNVYYSPQAVAFDGFNFGGVPVDMDVPSEFANLPLTLVNPSVNSSVVIDVPWYNFYSMIVNEFNPNNTESRMNSPRTTLGNLYIVINVPPNQSQCVFDVYRAMGDDAMFALYQGFPLRSYAVTSPIQLNAPPTNDLRLKTTSATTLILYSSPNAIADKSSLAFATATELTDKAYTLSPHLHYILGCSETEYLPKSGAAGTLVIDAGYRTDASTGYLDVIGGTCTYSLTDTDTGTTTDYDTELDGSTSVNVINAENFVMNINTYVPTEPTTRNETPKTEPDLTDLPSVIKELERQGVKFTKAERRKMLRQKERTLRSVIQKEKDFYKYLFFAEPSQLEGNIDLNIFNYVAYLNPLSLITAWRANRLASRAENIMDQGASYLERLAAITETLTTTATNTAASAYTCFSTVVTQIKDVFMQHVPEFVTSGISKFVDCSIHLYNLIFSRETCTRIASFVGLLVGLGMFVWEKMASLYHFLTAIFRIGRMTLFPTPDPLTGNAPDDDLTFADEPSGTRAETIANYFKFLFPVLVSMIGLPGRLEKQGWTAFKTLIVDSVKFSNDITRFFFHNMDIFSKFLNWFLGETQPDLDKILLINEKKDEMKKWVEASMIITQGHMRDIVFSSSGQQRHLDLLYASGCEYMKLFSTRRLNATAFLTVFRKIADLHQAVGQRVGRGRLVKEPVRLWFYGKPGVGKSNVASYITAKMLEDIPVVYDGACVYTRNFTDYWNGWADQPAVLYDDWGQTNAPESQQRAIEEFFSLASIAEFNAPMPAIEDKDRMVNPEMVVICSNQSHPNVNAVTTQQALLRRRDFLIECKLKPIYEGLTADDSAIPDDILSRYEHLEFKIMDRFTPNVQAVSTTFTIHTLIQYLITHSRALRERRRVASQARNQHLFSLTNDAWRSRLPALSPDVATIVRGHLAADTTTLSASIDRATTNSTHAGTVVSLATELARPPLTENDFASVVSGDCGMCDEYPAGVADRFRRPDCACITLPDDVTWPEGATCLCDIVIKHGDFCAENAVYYTRVPPGIFTEQFSDTHPTMIYIPLGASACSDMCHYQSPEARADSFIAEWERRAPGVMLPIRYYRQRMGFYLYGPMTQQTNDRILAEASDVTNYTAEHNVLERDTDNSAHSRHPLQNVYNPFNRIDPLNLREPYFTAEAITTEEANATTSIWTRVISCLAACVGRITLVVLTAIFVMYMFSWVYRILCSFFPALASGLAGVVTRFSLALISRAAFHRAVTEIIGNIASSGDVRTPRIYSTPVRLIGQAGEDEPIDEPMPSFGKLSQTTIFNNKFNENTCMLYLVDGKKGTRFGMRILMLGGRIGLMPMHYNSFIAARRESVTDVQLYVRNAQGNVTIIPLTLESITYRRILDLDLCVINLPERVPVFKKISSLFATAHICSDAFSGKARLYTPWDTANDHNDTDRVFTDVKFTQTKASYSGYDMNVFGYTYPFAQRGACMSILCDAKSGFIIGVHTTGVVGDNQGVSTITCRELISQIIDDTKTLEPGNVYETLLPAQGASLKLEGNFEPVGKLEPARELRTNVKTAIQKSPMYGLLANPPSRYPAIMTRPGEPKLGYGPLKEACEVQLNPPSIFPKLELDNAAKDLENELITVATPVTLKVTQVRSIDEAVLGKPGMPFFESLKLGTSPGYPLCVNKPGSHKSDFVAVDDLRAKVVMNEMLDELYVRDHEQRVRGVVPFVPYADFGKDERLKPGKGMRLINGAPFQEVIEWRRYCTDFFSAFQSAGLKVGSGIGINVFGHGMNDIAEKLLSRGTSILTGDYKAFGPRVMAEVTARVARVVNNWYDHHAGRDDEANRVRSCLFEELISCYHVAGDLVYRTICGNPSGNPFTAPLNTLVALMYLRVVWQLVFKKSTTASLSYFHKYFTYVCYGDDFIGSIHDSLKESWNTETMSSVFAKYGIVFTDVGKTGNIVKYASLQEASFLKCTFGRHPTRNMWIALLDKTVIEDIVSWYRKPCPNMNEYLVQVADQVIRFSFFHGVEYYNRVCSTVAAAFRARGVHWSYPTWDQMDCIFDDGKLDLWIDLW